MRFKPTRIVASVAVIGAIAAGGAAFTASETLPTNVAGYGTTTVTGGTVTDLNYDLSTTGEYIDTANLTFSGDVVGDTVGIGFDGYDSGALQTCTVGSFTTGSPGSTAVTCTLPATSVTTSAEDNVDVAVTGP